MRFFLSRSLRRCTRQGKAAIDGVLWALVSEIPSYDLVVPALLEQGVENLKEACSLTPGKSAADIPSFPQPFRTPERRH